MADTGQFNIAVSDESLGEWFEFVRLIKGREGDKYVLRAINYGAKQGKLHAVKKILEKSTIKSTYAKKKAVIKLGSLTNPKASLKLGGGKAPLEQFTGTRLTKKGVSFRLWKNSGLEKYIHAFAKGGNKSRGIWERAINDPEYDGRLPLKRKYGPSVAALFEKTGGVEKEVLNVASTAMISELNRLLNVNWLSK